MRSTVSGLLLLLGSIAAVVAATSVWAGRALLDETAFQDRAAAIALDPTVASAISDEILARIPVTVPPETEAQLREGVAAALREPRVQEGWARLNREAAIAVLAVAKGEPSPFVNAAGDVVVDPEPLLVEIEAAGGPLAEVIAQRQASAIVLIEAERLAPIRRVTDAVDAAPPLLIALAILLLGSGALLARGPLMAATTALVCLLAATAGVLFAFIAARDRAIERAGPGLAETIIVETFDTTRDALALLVGGAAVVSFGLVLVLAGLRARGGGQRPAAEPWRA